MPIAEIRVKEGYEEQETEISEFATEVPAQDFSETKRVDEITRALKKGNQKGDVLEILIKAAGCELIKPYGFILDNAGNTVTIEQIISYFGINTTASVRCSECHEVMTWSEIFFHLSKSYRKGHNMTLKQITNLFSKKWYNWVMQNGKFIK